MPVFMNHLCACVREFVFAIICLRMLLCLFVYDCMCMLCVWFFVFRFMFNSFVAHVVQTGFAQVSHKIAHGWRRNGYACPDGGIMMQLQEIHDSRQGRGVPTKWNVGALIALFKWTLLFLPICNECACNDNFFDFSFLFVTNEWTYSSKAGMNGTLIIPHSSSGDCKHGGQMWMTSLNSHRLLMQMTLPWLKSELDQSRFLN